MFKSVQSKRTLWTSYTRNNLVLLVLCQRNWRRKKTRCVYSVNTRGHEKWLNLSPQHGTKTWLLISQRPRRRWVYSAADSEGITWFSSESVAVTNLLYVAEKRKCLLCFFVNLQASCFQFSSQPTDIFRVFGPKWREICAFKLHRNKR